MKMEKTGKTNELRNIAGRDIGEETLECFGCGRFFGEDSVEHSPAEIGLIDCKGVCPYCGGFVYPKSKLPKRVSER
jgi:DNA-directed RNA polymerase subunit RPC12/RpoP